MIKRLRLKFIVMTSRGSSAEEKYLSIVISAAAARNQ